MTTSPPAGGAPGLEDHPGIVLGPWFLGGPFPGPFHRVFEPRMRPLASCTERNR